MYKQKHPQKEQGFTLVEVLVSILIATVFVATALQAMVVASLFKAKARQYAEATTWIQQDLENIRYRAAILTRNDTKCNPPSGDQVAGYAYSLREDLRLNLALTESVASPDSNPHTGTKAITGNTYILERDGPEAPTDIKPNVRDVFPYNAMTLKYVVKPKGGGDAIATIYTEVIPDAAFQCSQKQSGFHSD